MFVDQVKVFARAGHGGRGCVAFRREAHVPKGGPAGGNGGRGGHVILQASHDINNLIAQYYAPRLIAQNGEHGLGKGMEGKAGKDIVIKVPCGTVVWRVLPPLQQQEQEPPSPEEDEPAADEQRMLSVAGDEKAAIRYQGDARAVEIDLSEEPEPPAAPTGGDPGEPRRELVADLTEDGEQFVLCEGGRGGLGNKNFATARRQAPRFAQPGEAGGEGDFLLELRIIADVGLVGYPNAGKSTLLTAISHARPKIAPYPFTTLHPQIGVLEYPDFHRLTVCDVPGIIEGAHENVGLGHAFLRHIKRCKILVLVLDMAGTDTREPWDDFEQLLTELELYDPELAEKPQLIAANKMDEESAIENLREFRKRYPDREVLEMAAGFDAGIDAFKQAIRDAVERV